MPEATPEPLAPGQQVGRYRILGRLGAGGMGVVYKAEDPALGRLVALKFLPADQTGDAVALAAAVERFRRDARLAATLDHPNICTIYEIGEAQVGGTGARAGAGQARPFLAMQYLEGQTLRAKIAGRPLPLDRLLEWGAEIAAGLAAAHAKGIIHRDVKPANILITTDGRAKTLDFGLAKARPAEASPAAMDDDAPTLPYDAQLTTQGATLGTVAYMSPEQVRGEVLDARSDLFSFGLVLYEMATGRPAFAGATSGVIMDGILNRSPQPPQTLNPEVPEKLAAVIAKALEKDPDLRCQSAAELRADLLRLQRERRGGAAASGAGLASASGAGVPPGGPGFPGETSAGEAPAPPDARGLGSGASVAPAHLRSGPASAIAGPPSDSRILLDLVHRRRGPAIIIAVIVAALIAFAYWRLQAPPTPPAAGFSAAVPQLNFRQLTFTGNVQSAAISRDGKFLAYVERGAKGRSLHLLSINSGSGVRLVAPGNGCCYAPAIAPDDSAVYYLSEPPGNQPNAIKSVPILGGPPRTVLTNVNSGVAFSPDGRRIAYTRQAAPGLPGGLLVAHADGSGARLLAQRNPGFADLGFSADFGGPEHPAWSNDGRWIAATVLWMPQIRYQIEVFPAPGGARGDPGGKGVLVGPQLPGLNGLAWLPDGSLIATVSRHYEMTRLWRIAYPAGQMTLLAPGQSDVSGLSVAASGAFVTIPEQIQGGLWVGRPGSSQPMASISAGREMDGVTGVAWTPQGGLIASRALGSQYGLWRESADGSQAAPIPTPGLKAVWPVVAANGQIVFTAVTTGGASIWRMNADGSGLTNLTPGLKIAGPPSMLGANRVAVGVAAARGARLVTVPLAGGKPEPASSFTFSGRLVASPDGRHVFGRCIRTGPSANTGPNPEACVLDLAVSPPSLQWMPKLAGGKLPAWAPGGRGITVVRRRNGAENLWLYPLAGGAPRQITHFKRLLIAADAWSPDGRLAVSRIRDSNDAVLITP